MKMAARPQMKTDSNVLCCLLTLFNTINMHLIRGYAGTQGLLLTSFDCSDFNLACLLSCCTLLRLKSVVSVPKILKDAYVCQF